MKHQKIIIIGSPGSGKSTLARRLSEKTGLPVVHLDQLYWRPGWNAIPDEEMDELVLAELVRPRWIIDGNFGRTMKLRMEHCDAVIYLDVPRRVCLLGVIKRVISSYGKTRPDMGEGCPERFDPEFLGFIWRFNKKHRAKYHAMLSETDKTVYIVKSRKEIEPLLEQF